ncbi:MAG: PAS domain-containing protein [Bacteroidetes bacterium]|nr:PAS domain-containing protein [Bacteroidota bacterium]
MKNDVYNVIIVEDVADEAFLLERVVKKDNPEFKCTIVESFEDFKEKFLEMDWDAVISDYSFPEFNGLDVLKFVRERNQLIPFILVSGVIGEEHAVEIMKGGASDYVMKSSLIRLPVALRKEILDAEFKAKSLGDLALMKQLSLIAKHTTNPVVITNAENEIEWVNEAFVKAYEYTIEEVTGKTSRSILDGPDTNSDTLDYIKEMVAKHVSFSTEVLNYSKSGNKKWVIVNIEPLWDENENIERYFSIHHDITEKKAYESQLLKLNNTLEISVKERTKELEDLNEDLKSFNHTLANNLQHPVSIIGRWVDVLVKNELLDLPEQVVSGLQEIKKHAEKASIEINQLLLYSSAAQKIVNKSKCEIQDLLTVMSRELFYAEGKEVQKIIIEEPLYPCYADSSMIYHVLKNLLSNAFKFSSKEDKPVVKISSRKLEDTIVYSVEDNGVGFDMRYYELLFNPFSRLHADSEFEGNGIGLSITKRFVERNGGELWAESEVGKGSVFSFSMPAWDDGKK